MRAEVITIGTELLLGDIDDTNATHIAQQLREIGVDLYYRTTVGDNEVRIAEVIANALKRVDLVITTGGLGPTVDDVTREAIATATGRPLEFRQALFDQITRHFRRFNVTMSENNRQQAFVPQGAQPIENPVGTAPIFILETERGTVMTLPGVPREMAYLLEHELIPWISNHMETSAVIKSLTLRTAGIGESQIDARITDLMKNPNPTVGLAAHTGQTDIRIAAKAATAAEADTLIEDMAGQVYERLGRWIYGTDKELIEDVVAALLTEQNASVATVEVGTHGLLAERLCDAQPAGADNVVCTQALESLAEWQLYGVDKSLPVGELASRAAEAIRRLNNTTYGLVVIMRSQGGEVDEGVRGTEIALASAERTRARTFDWLHERTDAPLWATTHALVMLYRVLTQTDTDSED